MSYTIEEVVNCYVDENTPVERWICEQLRIEPRGVFEDCDGQRIIADGAYNVLSALLAGQRFNVRGANGDEKELIAPRHQWQRMTEAHSVTAADELIRD